MPVRKVTPACGKRSSPSKRTNGMRRSSKRTNGMRRSSKRTNGMRNSKKDECLGYHLEDDIYTATFSCHNAAENAKNRERRVRALSKGTRSQTKAYAQWRLDEEKIQSGAYVNCICGKPNEKCLVLVNKYTDKRLFIGQTCITYFPHVTNAKVTKHGYQRDDGGDGAFVIDDDEDEDEDEVEDVADSENEDEVADSENEDEVADSENEDEVADSENEDEVADSENEDDDFIVEDAEDADEDADDSDEDSDDADDADDSDDDFIVEDADDSDDDFIVEDADDSDDDFIVEDAEDEEDNLFEVNKIVAHKVVGDKMYYRVNWKGYSSSEDTWELPNAFVTSKALLVDYMTTHF